nr:hypothetical protein [Tanacetum cinerariifolium]
MLVAYLCPESWMMAKADHLLKDATAQSQSNRPEMSTKEDSGIQFGLKGLVAGLFWPLVTIVETEDEAVDKDGDEDYEKRLFL